ncbi:MAG TPA: sigma factor-like helix-turn-helix DNA-binding protein [Polyangiaceae bacterium]|nr:sigma factor-like helix-turn-helix DNA-binding protein [Polyangiaceae bacterium]
MGATKQLWDENLAEPAISYVKEAAQEIHDEAEELLANLAQLARADQYDVVEASALTAPDPEDAQQEAALAALESLAALQQGVAGEEEIGDEESGADGEQFITREQRRSRRKRAIRARTISVKRMTKRELEVGRLLYPESDYAKPDTREECVNGPRPCPYVSCKHHLFIDVSPKTGAIKLNFPDLEVWEMGESCALDVADRGGTTLEDVGAIMNLTRERIRQVEVKALAKLEALRDMEALRDFVDEGPVGKRRLPTLTKAELRNIDGEAEAEAKPAEDWEEEDEFAKEAEKTIDLSVFE